MQLSQFFPFPSCPVSHYVALRERHMLGPPQLKVCCREKVFARIADFGLHSC